MRYTDPSGYDPLDQNWIDKFPGEHGGRLPEWQDRLIRLFAIAFPDEWKWSAFYDAEGSYLEGSIEYVLDEHPPSTRSWAAIPGALERLAEWYTEQERSQFNRDVGTLFGGLQDRFDEPSTSRAVRNRNNPVHRVAVVNGEGAPPRFLGTDRDANIHHWGWAFTMGGAYGPVGPIINSGREALQVYEAIPGWGSIGAFLSTVQNCFADVSLGNAGAALGFGLRIGGTERIGQRWGFYMW